jgi:hypothetical protein
MGPYFSPVNSPWAINLLPHVLLLVAHGILIEPHGLGNLLLGGSLVFNAILGGSPRISFAFSLTH